MKRKIGDYIEDIIEAMANAMEFTKDITYDEFVKDTKTVYAVIRAIEITKHNLIFSESHTSPHRGI